MYSHSYIMPNNSNSMYRNNSSYVTYDNYPYGSTTSYYTDNNDDRFFLAPFLVGGLAGTALGYGIANNNQINNGNNCCPVFYPMQPMQPIYSAGYPINNSTNFFY